MHGARTGRLLLQVEFIMTAAGIPGLATREMGKQVTAVVDVGTSFVEGKMVGDVDIEGVSTAFRTVISCRSDRYRCLNGCGQACCPSR